MCVPVISTRYIPGTGRSNQVRPLLNLLYLKCAMSCSTHIAYQNSLRFFFSLNFDIVSSIYKTSFEQPHLFDKVHLSKFSIYSNFSVLYSKQQETQRDIYKQ